MLDAGMDLRDVQIAARHADPRTTMSYDRARKNLDRRPNYILAAYSLWHLTCRASGAARAGETSGIADVRAIALHCPEGPLKSRPNNDEFQQSSRSSVTSTFRANLEAS
jgi:hypothetical protein